MEVGCMIFSMKHRKKPKKYAIDNGLRGWNDMAVWRNFRPLYIPEDIWPQYIQYVTSEWFIRCSQFDADNQNRQIHGSVTTHTNNSVPFTAHAKWMVRLILIKYILN